MMLEKMVVLFQQKKTLEKTKTKNTIFRESWLGPPPSKSLEILFFLFFQGFFGFCGFFQCFLVFRCFCKFFQGFSQVWGTARKLARITGKALKVPLGVQ